MNANINFIQNRIRLIPTSVEHNANIQRQIQANENKINQIDKKIEHKEKLITMEQGLLDSGKVLLKDLVESRDLTNKQIKLLEDNISLLGKMIDAAKVLLKIKQDEAKNSANLSMKYALPKLTQAASLVTSQQANDISSKRVNSILSTVVIKEGAKPFTKFDYKIRAGEEKIAYTTLGKDNKSKEDIKFTNELGESYSRFSSMFKAYRAEMKSIDRMFSFLRIKV